MDTAQTWEEEGAEQAPSSEDLHKWLKLPYPIYVEGGEWRDHALCKGMGNLDFFGDTKELNKRHIRVARAKAICANCTVRKECFNFAKQNNERHGVWGGVDFFVSSKAKYRRVIPDTID